MASVIQYKDGFRIYDTHNDSFVGPIFETEKDANSFISWYDGNVSIIGTWLDSRSWDVLIKQWKDTLKDDNTITNKWYKSDVSSWGKKLTKMNSGEMLLQSMKQYNNESVSFIDLGCK